jgi:peptidoglycan/LPS O-acetylase OafA/YrhL
MMATQAASVPVLPSPESIASTRVDEQLSIGRVPVLDGIRGIAILMVLLDHIQFALLGRFLPGGQLGQHGVTLFFVLSGFLITSKLLEGPIDLRRFFLRRFFRLMPVAWTYLAAVLLFDRLSGAKFTSIAEVRSCLFFYRNFFPGSSGAACHFWSLSLEEQFYLVWPVLLLLAGVRRCRWIAIAGAASCALYRWLNWSHYDNAAVNIQSQVRADALLVGCLLAMLLANPGVRSAVARWSKLWAFPAAIVVAFCIARYHFLPPLYESVCLAGLIAATLTSPQSALARPLSSRTLVYLGTISYSIYVWQEFFMAQPTPPNFASTLLLIVGIPVCALSSYYLIERPCRNLGHRLTAGHIEAGDASASALPGIESSCAVAE